MDEPTLSPSDVTRLLGEWRKGETGALDRLMPVVYEELRRIAVAYMQREKPGHTLQPTALVSEAYLHFAGDDKVRWESRAHFFGSAAQAMRRILVDHARKQRAAKRGGGGPMLSINEEALAVPQQRDVELLALDDALKELAVMDPEQARLVELRYFGGLTMEETAGLLGISPATARRHWATAKLWLADQMRRSA